MAATILDQQTKPIFRFAPSPTGELHLGHAFSALENLRLARAMGGKMLLRIEDIDQSRCRPAYETAMLRELEWLGFEWDEAPLRQSDHLDIYRDAIDALLNENLAYPAFLSRKQARLTIDQWETKNGRNWPRDPDGSPHYPGKAQNDAQISRDEPALRLDIKAALAYLSGSKREKWQAAWQEGGLGPEGQTGTISADPGVWGDFLLSSKDRPASYHLASVIDDARQNISHVVRGVDLFWSSSAHCLLQEIFGFKTPFYHHHGLVLDDDGKKLAKSRNSTSLYALRQSGMTPRDIRRMIGIYRVF